MFLSTSSCVLSLSWLKFHFTQNIALVFSSSSAHSNKTFVQLAVCFVGTVFVHRCMHILFFIMTPRRLARAKRDGSSRTKYGREFYIAERTVCLRRLVKRDMLCAGLPRTSNVNVLRWSLKLNKKMVYIKILKTFSFSLLLMQILFFLMSSAQKLEPTERGDSDVTREKQWIFEQKKRKWTWHHKFPTWELIKTVFMLFSFFVSSVVCPSPVSLSPMSLFTLG